MAQFMYLYRGPAPTAAATAEQQAQRAAAFGAWMERLGPALVEVGSPFGVSAAVRDDDTPASPGEFIGYSIVSAPTLADAVSLTHGLPFLAERDGEHVVEVFELAPM